MFHKDIIDMIVCYGLNQSIMSSRSAKRLTAINFSQEGTSGAMGQEWMVPKLAVSKGLSSEATMYKM